MADHRRAALPSPAANMRYAGYASPVGDLVIVGDDDSVKALFFHGHGKQYFSTDGVPRKGETRSIAACRAYLDCYFGSGLRENKNVLLKQSSRYDIKKSTIYIAVPGLIVPIDCSAFTSNECAVYAELIKIPIGTTISYGALAVRSGFSGGARFAGNTMRKNMVPILIPCHRVIRSDGSMGNYSGGVHIKKHLLDLEASN